MTAMNSRDRSNAPLKRLKPGSRAFFPFVSSCANVTLRDCFVTGHKTYTTY